MNELTGKTAFITGSSRDIGRAAGLKLASLGAKVIFHGVKESEKLLSAVADARPETGFVKAFEVDHEEEYDNKFTLIAKKTIPFFMGKHPVKYMS